MCILHNIQDNPFISSLCAPGMVFPTLTLKDSVFHCWSLLSCAALVLLLHPHLLSEISSLWVISSLVLSSLSLTPCLQVV